VDMLAADLVGINGITRVLLVYTVSNVCTLEATYYHFDSRLHKYFPIMHAINSSDTILRTPNVVVQ
jgi:hypothetical protein